MNGEHLAAEIKKYECALERTKRLGWNVYIPHFEIIVKELKAIQELDAGFERVGPEAAKQF